jgi:outer membrane protein, heavy metal efflux system
MANRIRRARVTLTVALSMALLSVISRTNAQQAASTEFTFRRIVDQVNVDAKRLTATDKPIEGWMGNRTVAHNVTNDVLSRLKPGDQVTTNVSEGDFTRYDIALVLQTGPAPVSSGTTSASLRLETLEQMALVNNPTVAQVQANLRIASGLATQAGLYPNPAVGYYGDEVRGGLSGGGKQGGFVTQTIVLGGKLRAARRVAQLRANQVETSGQIQHLRILNNVRSAFYLVLAAQRLVEVRQNLAKVAVDAIQTSLQLANVGQADRPDVLQAQVEQEQANVAVRVAEQNLESSWRFLAAVVGKPDLTMVRLEGDLDAIPDLNYEEWVATTLRESPEVRLAQQEVQRAEASLAQARKAPIPDLQLTGLLFQNYEPLETTTRKPTGLQGGALISVQLPIFNHNQGGIAAANGEIDSAKLELARLKLQLQRDLAGMFRDYNSARLIVQQYKVEMLPRAEQAYRLYQANYQKMAGAYPQVLISQRTLFQLEADYVEALENAWQSALLIRGFGLMDGLLRPINAPVGVAASGAGMGSYNVPAVIAQ